MRRLAPESGWQRIGGSASLLIPASEHRRFLTVTLFSRFLELTNIANLITSPIEADDAQNEKKRISDTRIAPPREIHADADPQRRRPNYPHLGRHSFARIYIDVASQFVYPHLRRHSFVRMRARNFFFYSFAAFGIHSFARVCCRRLFRRVCNSFLRSPKSHWPTRTTQEFETKRCS